MCILDIKSDFWVVFKTNVNIKIISQMLIIIISIP